MLYSYQDCWNYAFSIQKSNLKKDDLQRDLIAICQIPVEKFWFNFHLKLLTKKNYLNICQKIDKYCQENYPTPYMNRGVGFYQLFFRTERGIFIPQKDTEILVEKLLELVDENWPKLRLRVLDIGTGCGNIVISLAKIKPDWQFVATDINRKAIKLAKKNALIHQTKNVKFIFSNLFTGLNFRSRFDIIVSNPPYISQSEYQQLSPQTKKQPKNALLAPQKGYHFYRKIFQKARSFLAEKFLLLVEIGSQLPEKLLSIMRKRFSDAQVKIFSDLSGRPRIIVIYKNKIK